MNTTQTTLDIGIQEQDRQAVTTLLKSLMADEFVLYVKTRNFHWNVTGPHFSELHAFFEKQYAALDDIIDDIAERIRTLGQMSPGSMRELLDGTRLKEIPAQTLPAETMLELLLEDHENLIRTLRKDLVQCLERHNDAGTCDYLTGLMERHEKMAWMQRSFLAK